MNSTVRKSVFLDSAMEEMRQNDEVKNLFEKAAEFVVKRQEASCSLLQREFGIDFTSAVKVMMELEHKGIVGGFDGVETRKVLVKEKDVAGSKLPVSSLQKGSGR